MDFHGQGLPGPGPHRRTQEALGGPGQVARVSRGSSPALGRPLPQLWLCGPVNSRSTHSIPLGLFLPPGETLTRDSRTPPLHLA